MARKLKFDLNVESNALLCPNSTEFYSKCYISEDVVNNFRVIPGVKDSTKISNVVFNDVLKASSCDFVSGTGTLDSKTIDVCALSIQQEVCQFDIESSFLSLSMARGSNGEVAPAAFMNFYWDELAKKAQEEISVLRWKGNASGTGGTYLDLCDGLEKKLAAGSAVGVTATGITAGNVITEMTKVYTALPAACKFKTKDLRFYVAADIAASYMLAAASGNTQAYITAAMPLTFLGITVVPQEGMTTGKMVLTIKDNLIYAFDLMEDAEQLEAVNMRKTTAESKIRTAANLKVGFNFVNPAQIVYYA
jgi:hypothetical protein